jgi:hypothetical protein
MPQRPVQPDLLTWEPPQAELAFAERDVRGSTLDARISRAVSVALSECGKSRAAVAREMSAFLGETVSQPMLDAYASVAREAHRISVSRFLALVHATGDRRLLQLIADHMSWAVVERRHLPLIEVALLREHEDELRRKREALMRKARGG